LPFARLPEPGRDLRLVRSLAALMRERRFDVVHTHMSKAALAGAVAARLVRPRPMLVNTAHNLGSIALSQPMLRRLFRLYDRALLGGATDAVIVVSEAIRQEVLRLGVVDAARLHAVPNGTLTGRFGAHPAEAAARRAELGAAPEDTLVVTVARLVWFKGLETLIDAAARLAPAWPRLRLAVVGDGPLRAALEQRVAERGLTGRVIFTGERADVPEILAAADIFALSSVSEGMPISILEAMAARLPVVATAVGGIPELVGAGETGLLAPARDAEAFAAALETLVASPALRRQYGDAGRNRLDREFSASAMVQRTAAIYGVLLRADQQGCGPAAGCAA
jgi:glycosyltransferase involved in cell wall biosynthesis